jgi:hypothetical protein
LAKTETLLKNHLLLKDKQTRSYLTILFGCWAAVQAWLFWKNGIQTDLEAAKYIEQANVFLNTGSLSTSNFYFYSLQIFLILLVKKAGLPYLTVVIVQWLANLLATFCLFRLVEELANSNIAAFITACFILNIPIQTFNSFLQTDSLFYSITVIYTCFLFRLKELSLRNAMYVFLFLLLMLFTRPNGIFWWPATALYLFFRFFRHIRPALKLTITAASGIIVLFLLNRIMGSGGELDFMLPFRDERIICGVPTIEGFKDIKMSGNPNSIAGIVYYISHNFEQFSRLALRKTVAFFGLYRSYFSIFHNIQLLITIVPFYFFALFSIRHWFRKSPAVLLFCLFLIFITWLSVIFSCDDWHNRFFLSINLYFYILSVPALIFLEKKWQLARHANKNRNAAP